jgi:hypothetical protein
MPHWSRVDDAQETSRVARERHAMVDRLRMAHAPQERITKAEIDAAKASDKANESRQKTHSRAPSLRRPGPTTHTTASIKRFFSVAAAVARE